MKIIDYLSFALSNKDGDANIKGLDVSWHLCFPKDEESEWKKQLGSGSVCTFKLEPDLFGKYIANDEDLFLWEVDHETNIVYSKGVVRAEIVSKQGNKSVVEYPIRIEVLPMMPRVVILSYWEKYDEAYGVGWPNVELEIMTDNYNGGYVYTTYTQWEGSVTGCAFMEDTPMPYRVLVDWGGPGCGYGCIISNKYGILTSPPVFPDKETSAISIREIEVLQIRQHGDKLRIDLPYRADEVTIVGISGRQYYSQCNVSNLCIPLPRGMYMVTVKHEGAKQVYKINKK